MRRLAPGVIRLTDPNGVTFHVHAQPPLPGGSTFTGFNVDRGIAYVHLPCHVGTAAAIAKCALALVQGLHPAQAVFWGDPRPHHLWPCL